MSREAPAAGAAAAWIPFARPAIGEAEEAAALECLRSGRLTNGPRVEALEARFAERVGARYAVAVSSCTAALHLALEGLGIGPGDRVVTSDFTFTATAEAIRLAGAEPVPVDIDPQDLNLAPSAVAQALCRDPRIRAVVPVHYAGQACAIETLLDLARRHGITVVEDAAHAFPAAAGMRSVGSIGDATAFSLYATKPVAAGEGGILTTDDPALAERARLRRLHGIRREPGAPAWRYEVVDAGYKYNLPDLAAAIALPQVERAEALRARRQAIAERYRAAFADLPRYGPSLERPAAAHAWHLFALQLDLERLRIDRDRFIAELAERGVEASVHFIPLHRHAYWREACGLAAADFPKAEAAYHRVVSLPLSPALTDAEVERVIAAVREVLTRYRR